MGFTTLAGTKPKDKTRLFLLDSKSGIGGRQPKMKTTTYFKLTYVLVCTTFVRAATPVPIKHPVTPVADSAHAFVSAPFCVGPAELPRGVYDITSGTPIKIADIPSADGSCFETPLVMASGLGGFTAGYLYLAYPDLNNPGLAHLARVPQIGGPLQAFADLTLQAGTTTFLTLRLDSVGTFGYNLIAMTGEGELFILNSAGTTVVHKLPGAMGLPTGGDTIEYENPRVMPLTFGAHGGWLWVTNENLPAVYAINPVTYQAEKLTVSLANGTQLPGPFGVEDFVYLGANQCSYKGATVAQAVYEGALGSPNASEAGQVMFSDMSAYKDKLLVISEDRGFAFFINPDGTLGGLAPYPPSGLFLEHLNPVTGRTDTGACLITKGCTLTQGGYKNHFNSQVLQLPTGGLWLGNNFYTNAQLDSIIQNNAIRGNGLLSLAHQLITAELNIYYGAQVTPAVALAIVQAQALIGNLTIPPVGSDSLPTSDTSSIQSILDTFNNGNSAGGPGHC